jgi:hypothetical protein
LVQILFLELLEMIEDGLRITGFDSSLEKPVKDFGVGGFWGGCISGDGRTGRKGGWILGSEYRCNLWWRGGV